MLWAQLLPCMYINASTCSVHSQSGSCTLSSGAFLGLGCKRWCWWRGGSYLHGEGWESSARTGSVSSECWCWPALCWNVPGSTTTSLQQQSTRTYLCNQSPMTDHPHERLPLFQDHISINTLLLIFPWTWKPPQRLCPLAFLAGPLTFLACPLTF